MVSCGAEFAVPLTFEFDSPKGDTLPPLMEWIGASKDSLLSERWFLMLVCTIFIVFPLCLVSKLSSLRFTSLFGFIATVYVILAIIARTSQRIEDDGM